MQLRLMDEVMDLGPRGVALLCAAEDAGALRCGMRLIDARGRGHVVSAVTMQDGPGACSTCRRARPPILSGCSATYGWMRRCSPLWRMRHARNRHLCGQAARALFCRCGCRVPQASASADAVTVIEVPDEPEPAQPGDAQNEVVLRREGERILARLTDRDHVIALCVDAKQYESPELAARLDGLFTQGKSHIAFVIGGSLGLHPSGAQTRRRAHEHEPHDLSPPAGAGHAAGAALSRGQDQRRGALSQVATGPASAAAGPR